MLAEILKANQAFVARRPRGPANAPFSGPAKKLAIVTCMDARLVGLIPDALGCSERDAVVIRNAGNTITRWDESIPRSVAAAVYLQDVRHVAVVGHTDCRMAGDTLALADGMRRAGISRDGLGDRDLREWFGIFGGVEANVRAVVDALRRSRLLPGGIGIYGLIIDTETGELRGVADEKSAGQAEGRAAPRSLDSLEKVLGGKVLEASAPKAVASPVAAPPPEAMSAPVAQPAPPAAWAPARPEPPPAAPKRPAPEPKRKDEPARLNVRRDPVPLDPREAQEFFRRREQERLRMKEGNRPN